MPVNPEPEGQAVSRERLIRVAAFRAALRAFLRESDAHIRKSGLTPQRYLLLLMVVGAPDGRGAMTVTDVAGRLRLSRNAVSELASRAEAEGLLFREPDVSDARFVRLRATPEGERRVRAVIAEGDHARAELAHALGVLPDVFAASHQH
jgi:DNA-binding MarR family transcriptional regulator